MSRKGVKNRRRTGIVTIVLVVMLVVMTVNIGKLYQKNKEYEAKKEELEKEYAKEEERKEELSAYEEFTQTVEYVEQIAREKLGLVFDNEIIFIFDED